MANLRKKQKTENVVQILIIEFYRHNETIWMSTS
jgi:hypothetical protein